MVTRKHDFKFFSVLLALSFSQDVTGIVHAMHNKEKMLGKSSLSQAFTAFCRVDGRLAGSHESYTSTPQMTLEQHLADRLHKKMLNYLK
jgi:hypothetical protein